MCATFSGVSRDTDQGVETCVQVSRESDPCGTDGDGRSRGSPAQAQASARVDVPTAPLFCSADHGVHFVRTSFFVRESLDMRLTNNRRCTPAFLNLKTL